MKVMMMLMMILLVTSQYQYVTDGRTDGWKCYHATATKNRSIIEKLWWLTICSPMHGGLSLIFYRAMHCRAKSGLAIACLPSVCLSVRPSVHLSICYYDGLIGSPYALSISTKINDLGWPWKAETHSCANKIVLLITQNIWMQIDTYYQRQNVG